MARSKAGKRLHAVDALQSALQVEPAMASEGPGWRDVTACLWRSPWISAYELAQSDELIVAVHTGGVRNVRSWIRGGWSTTVSNPGHAHVIPVDFATAFKPQGELEFVSVHIRPERLCAVTNDGASRPPPVPYRFAFHDDFVAACVQALADEMRAPREHGPLFVDSVTDALALHVLRPQAPRAVWNREPTSISRRALTRACERIEESLEGGVTLDELAKEAGSSRFHFARAFRAAMGVPPHRYLTARRIERAKYLLRHTALGIVDVALAVGFGNQSHFTLRFREATGVTPRRFRESR